MIVASTIHSLNTVDGALLVSPTGTGKTCHEHISYLYLVLKTSKWLSSLQIKELKQNGKI